MGKDAIMTYLLTTLLIGALAGLFLAVVLAVASWWGHSKH